MDFDPPQLGEPLFSVVYVMDGIYWPTLQYAGGHVYDPPGEEDFQEGGQFDPGYLWAEVVQRPEPRRSRAVGGESSNGSPVFNCDGALVGVFLNSITQVTGLGVLPSSWEVAPNMRALRATTGTNMVIHRLQSGK